MSAPTVLVELRKYPPGLRRMPGRKPEQPYGVMVSDAANSEPFEKSTERYRREESALDMIEQVHGPDATVVLRREGHPDRVLRRPATRRVELTEDEISAVVQAIWGGEVHHPDFRHTVTRIIGGINQVVAP